MKFTIPIAPMPRQEPHRSINGRMYTPKRMREYMDTSRWYLKECMKNNEKFRSVQLNRWHKKRPLKLTIKVFIKPPKIRRLDRPSVRPDLSNYIKLIEDCMNGILYKDDGQIVEYGEGTGKYYSENPRWEITIEEI